MITVSNYWLSLTNHGLELVNTFFSTPINRVSRTFNGQGQKSIDYILTRQRDRKIVRDVVLYPQALLTPISDHDVVAARVKLLGRFARNHPVRSVKKPPIDRRRLTTDPYLREEVARAIGDRLRATPPNGSSVNEVEAAFTVDCAAARA